MPEQPIDIARVAALRERDLSAEGLVLAEGRLLAERFLEAARRSASAAIAPPRGGFPPPRFEALGLACVSALAESFGPLCEGLCDMSVLPEAALAAIAGYPFHRGVMALGRRFPPPPAAELLGGGGSSRIVVLPATVDPENMGSIMRSAAALGWDALVLGPGCCDRLSRRAIRVSMGAAFSLPVLGAEGPELLGALSSARYAVAAAVLGQGARPLRGWSPPPRLALLFGNEYEGLGPEWLVPGVERLTIDMAPESDSLNVAAAAAVFLAFPRLQG
jgi:tRNA G18 (ribose-2'-O)-methylase SpoU